MGTNEHLRLYRFRHAAASTAERSMQLISSVGGLQQLRCVAWSPRADRSWMLAIGTAAGKVILHDCAPTALRAGADAESAVAPTSARCEFVPASQRMCFSMAWNPVL